MRPVVIMVHGGAGMLADASVPGAKAGVEAAAAAGFAILSKGGSAMDAVEAAVRSLENNTYFNAGTGSALTREGTVECDALIMDGRTMASGSVIGATNVKNPISLARAVNKYTPHSIIAGAGPTLALARKVPGIELVDNAELVVESRRKQLAAALAVEARGAISGFCIPDAAAAIDPNADAASIDAAVEAEARAALAHVDAGDHDTVGAVALDAYGHVACGTSTGGLTAKMPGRVGDSALPGSGGYAVDEDGAVSTTGPGEFILRYNLAKEICLEYGRLSEGKGSRFSGGAATLACDAVGNSLYKMYKRAGGDGAGAIFVTPTGEIGLGHTSHRMSWAFFRAQVEVTGSGEGGAGAEGATGITVGAIEKGVGVQLGIPETLMSTAEGAAASAVLAATTADGAKDDPMLPAILVPAGDISPVAV